MEPQRKEAGVSVEESKRVVQSLYDDVFNAGKMEMLDEFLADDFVEHEIFPGIPPTKEGVKQFFQMMRTAFPDLHVAVGMMVAEGDLVVAHVKFEGTHQADFLGIPATGKPMSVAAIDILRVRDGRAREHWGLFDQLAMMQQLGVVPAP
jgi:steroid delta-isomerase-like uncharacterized protein